MSGLADYPGASTYPNYLDYLGYGAMHAACLGALWTTPTTTEFALFGVSYVVRMFGVMVGFHRYFSHRSFKTSRAGQFVLALLGTLGVQKGVLWWASHHRFHHRYSDTEVDVHSPVQRSFLYSHCGWMLDRRNRSADFTRVTDLLKFPELVWLNTYDLIPQTALAGLLYYFFGFSGLMWGFFLPTILLWHAIHGIGSFGHRFGGYRRFATTDNSRNKWLLAIFLLGEGWHNNHHFYPSSARQGFVWWEYDPGWYILKVLSWFGLVWDLRTPPEELMRERGKGLQASLRRFGVWVQRLRQNLHRSVDLVATETQPQERLHLEILKQEIELRVDAFETAATNHILRDPSRLGESIRELDAGLAADAERLGTELEPQISAALPRSLHTELVESLQTCPFRHFIAKEFNHDA